MTTPHRGRTLLIGLGGIGMGYDLAPRTNGQAGHTVRTHAAAIHECAATTLIGGIDPSEQRRIEFEAAFQAPSWASIDGVPDTKVDILVIATPTETHKEVIAQAIEKFSPRLLLCEKPVGSSAAEKRSILTMAQERDATLVVNYFRHHLPTMRDVRGRLLSGDFGEFSGGSVLYSHGLRRNGSHFIALLLWLLGDAEVTRRFGPNAYIEDPSFTLRFGDPVVGFSAVGHGRVRAAEICLGFSRGLLRINSGGRMVSWAGVDDDAAADSATYGEVRWEREEDMLRCQLPIYEWLTSPDLKSRDVEEGTRVALHTQEIVDEVTRGTGQ